MWRDDKQFNLSDLRLAGSLFLGYDTVIGPLYLGYGYADGGHSTLYFYLGKTF